MLLLELPLAFRAGMVFLLGLLLAGQLNRAIYSWAVFARRISPWSPPEPKAPPRRWFDRLPVLGWITLRREEPLHGRGFWIRPLLIELLTALGLAGLYVLEVRGALIAPGAGIDPTIAEHALLLHAQFLAHGLLIVLMIPATFIDFDEQTIPDEITVPGMLLGLLLSTFLPTSRLLTLERVFPGGHALEPLLLTSPQREMILVGPLPVPAGPPHWPAWLDGGWGLALAIACLAGYCFGILDRRWITRRGWRKAIPFFLARIVRRNGIWWKAILIGLFGSLLTVAVWRSGAPWWPGLLSSLLGMAFGGGLVWAVRLLGQVAMGREAMGFGDVTLMAMLGAFLGWQGALLVFLLAPFMALFIAVAQLLLTRSTEIAFGPYLCLAALVLLLGWGTLWEEYAKSYFELGWFLPGLLLACLPLMALLLWGWLQIKRAAGWE